MSTELMKTTIDADFLRHDSSGESEAATIHDLSALLETSNHEDSAMEIVKCLGGIDHILREYIRVSQQYEDDMMSKVQIQQICDLLNNPTNRTMINEHQHTETIWDRIYAKANLQDEIFHLSRSHTFLHCICGDHIAHQVRNVIFSRITIIVLYGLIGTSWTIISGVQRTVSGETVFDQYWFDVVVQLFLQILFILHLLLMTLSTNIYAFLLIIASFDFYVKTGYAVALLIANGIYIRRGFGYDSTYIRHQDMICLMNVFSVIGVSLVEGYAHSWKVSFGFGLGVSIWFSLNALGYTLLYDLEEREMDLFGMKFDLLAFIASAWRVLSLFVWKQTLMAVYTRGEWCICIYLSPQIKWIEDVKEENKSDTVRN